MNGTWKAGAASPLRALWAPGAAFDDAAGRRAAATLSLVLLLAAAGALALPRLLALLDLTLRPTGDALLDAHLGVLRAGLSRLLVFERLVLPLPFLAAGALLALFAAPVLAGRGVKGGSVVAALAVGAAPLLVQRAGELAVVLAAPGAGLTSGDVAVLPARFNVGVAGALAAFGGHAPGLLGVAAEAANGVGLWVVLLWGWGLARLDRDAARAARPASVVGWCIAALGAYAAGWALYAALYPTILLAVMGAP